MTDTAKHADLILPASMPFEMGGSFTNTQKVIQEFEAVLPSKLEMTSLKQLSTMLSQFKMNGFESPKDVMMEALTLLPEEQQEEKLKFQFTKAENCNRTFNYGCDVVVKRFEEQFEQSLKE